MQIDPKYFNVFLLVVAIAAAILIAVFTLKNRSNEKEAFEKRIIEKQDSLRTIYWTRIQDEDSLRISDYSGDFVILDFWANWSGATEQSHQLLAQLKNEYPDTLHIIAAAVGLTREEATSYIGNHNYPFKYVAGSQQFKGFQVPGIPAQVVFNPNGEVKSAFLGFQGEGRLDSLRSIIRDGK